MSPVVVVLIVQVYGPDPVLLLIVCASELSVVAPVPVTPVMYTFMPIASPEISAAVVKTWEAPGV